MKKKKGQLAIFIIVGIILIFAFGILLVMLNVAKEKPLEERDLTAVDSDQLNNFISLCVENVVNDGVNTLGLRGNALEQYMNHNIQKCTNNFEDFEKQGFKVNISTINSTVTISENAVAAYVNYPVEITLKDFNFKSFLFNSILNRKEAYKLPVENGRIRDTITITSPDGRMELIILKGTRVNTDEIKIGMRNNDYDKDENAIMIPMIYEFTEGVTFSPSATLVYTYDERILPELTNENSLKLSYYDKNQRKMIQLPSVVDTKHNKITSSVEHFTDVTVTTDCSCLNKEQAEKELELEKPKIIFNLSDEECVQETEEQEEEEEVIECDVEDEDACKEVHPTCEVEGGQPWSGCIEEICKFGCACVDEEECSEGYKCENSECVLDEETEEEEEQEEDEEVPITTCEESQITKTENEDGSVNYKFRMKPSDCGEDGVCYLAFMVQDDSKIIGFSPEESPEETEENEEPEETTEESEGEEE